MRSKGQYVRCPVDGCRQVNRRDVNSGALCVCSSCGYAWCCHCHVEWHVEQTCAQYLATVARTDKQGSNNSFDPELQKLIDSGSIKMCPNCQHWGQKEHQSQCNAITYINLN